MFNTCPGCMQSRHNDSDLSIVNLAVCPIALLTEYLKSQYNLIFSSHIDMIITEACVIADVCIFYKSQISIWICTVDSLLPPI